MIPAFEAFPLLFLQRVKVAEATPADSSKQSVHPGGSRAYYVCWTNDKTDGDAHEATLSKLVAALNDASLAPADDLWVLANIQEMPLSFVTTHLYGWIAELQTTRGWAQITKCGVVLDSECVRTVMALFASDSHVSYHTTLTEACDELGIDVDTLL